MKECQELEHENKVPGLGNFDKLLDGRVRSFAETSSCALLSECSQDAEVYSANAIKKKYS